MCNKDCAICLEPLFTNTDPKIMRLKKKVLVKRGERLPITKLKCGHYYHSSCIKNWFLKTEVESSTKCPMCRDKIRFKPHSKDFMMHKLRYEDKSYEYGDENMYEIDTDSDYDDDEREIIELITLALNEGITMDELRDRLAVTDSGESDYDDSDYDDSEEEYMESDLFESQELVA